MARRKIDPEAGRATQFQTGGKQAQTAKKGGIARGERIVTPSAQMAAQPGGVLRFTIALDPVPFWNLHLVAENQAAKNHSAVLRADSQAAAYPPGCPQFWGDQSITVTPPKCFSLAYIFVTSRKC